ncbi:MAG: PHP domain-containing protein [Methanocorpusculum sp.]|nr:PHP domain-containing protein [Methanocorpusculum sp.]
MQTILCDLHIHSDASADGHCPVEKIIQTAKERGFDAVAITDHDTTRGASAAAALKHPGILIIPGIEVSTKDGHIVVLGTTKEFAPGKDACETIAEAKADGCLTIVPHPYHRWRHAVGLHNKAALKEADAIEAYNSRYYVGTANQKAARTARAYGKPITAGSDAHDCRFVGYGMNKIEVEELTAAAVLDAVRAGRIAASCKKTPIRTYTHQSWNNVMRKVRRRAARLRVKRIR